MRGIAAAGAYVPRFRLSAAEIEAAWGTAPRGIETKAVPAADEDALTMAVAAADAALDRGPVDPGDLRLVGLATTTPPLEESMLVPRLVRALDLPRGVEAASEAGSTAAGAAAIGRALDADGPALAVASDCPEGDPADADARFGAGAAAFLVTDDPAVAVRGRAWHVDEYPGVRYRERGSREVDSLGITAYERDAVRTCVGRAVDRLDVGDVHAAALHQPDGRLPYRLARDLPVETGAIERGTVADRIGDAGAATVPLGLIAALGAADDGDTTLAAFFGGGGGAAAFALEGGLDAPLDLDGGEELPYARYLRERGYVADGDVAGGGAHVSVPAWRRTLDSRYRLAAGRCPDCAALAFPPEGACPDCGARVEFERVELPRTGRVVARTVIASGGEPPEFADLQARSGAYGVAIVEFRADGRVRLPGALTDCDPGGVEVGDEVRAVVRRIYTEEGVPRYGAKFVPA